MSKTIHYQDTKAHVQYGQQLEKGYSFAICGYMRKKVTLNKNDVTCYWCKNKIKELLR
jgi:hypothetical protein